MSSKPMKDENRGNEQTVYTGTTQDAYDIRYQDDQHRTYGKQYSDDEDDE